MKVSDLIIHKNPKLIEHQGAHIVTFVGPTAIQILGHTGFHPPSDWEVINDNLAINSYIQTSRESN